ncbi:hypothetical protein [Bordetella sp. N]|uniref:hypothetical protein n=1 Tax=Bordetella sp. N TaxID=1746199 RepID=UPI00070BC777|nr:hypothetical protein [Bordetella sp. N]ALM85687.1 hypothetical protein ASB57_24440 [Bordetella sp. N]
MSDLGLIIPKANLFSSHKHGITGADEAQNSDSFQQQLSQALGVSAQTQVQSTTAANTDEVSASSSTAASASSIGTMSIGSTSASTLDDSSVAAATPEDQLRQYTSSSLAQQMFFTMLSSMGITKEQFQAMSPQEQAQITQQLQDRLKQAASTGQLPGAVGLGQTAAAAPVQASAASSQTSDVLSTLQALL